MLRSNCTALISRPPMAPDRLTPDSPDCVCRMTVSCVRTEVTGHRPIYFKIGDVRHFKTYILRHEVQGPPPRNKIVSSFPSTISSSSSDSDWAIFRGGWVVGPMDPFAAFSAAGSAGAAVQLGAPMSKQGKVLFDYSPQASNQIALKKGQQIRIISVGGGGGWSKGEEIGTGTGIDATRHSHHLAPFKSGHNFSTAGRCHVHIVPLNLIHSHTYTHI